MAIFLDTGDINEIMKYKSLGIISGVTTNPTILKQCGISNKDELVEIIHKTFPFPVSVEVTTNDKEKMIIQAIEFFRINHRNVNIKIPIHGPNGELENLEIITRLEKRKRIPVNVTAMMNAQQGFIAAMAGATYVSIFGGRVADMGYDTMAEIRKLRHLIDRFQLKAKIILGSSREVVNIIDWLMAGADIITVTPDLLKKMIIHPRTETTVRQFLEDGRG